MADWSVPGLVEAARVRLEEAGFTPQSVARAKPSELVRRAGLRADLARRVVAHYREGPVESAPEAAPAERAAPDGVSREAPPEEGREWERVWEFGSHPARPGTPWRWRGRVSLKVSLLRGP